ncbi:MAG TPA: alpha/beta hydrolase [Solirubrobacterales bacterium]|nr:alpha/beta hydrolase [Solirubrobacterales bacterium]
MSGPDNGVVEVRPGRTIAWTAVGDGPPLLLVNGYAATGADWDPSFLGLLAARHRVICPDNAGLGNSELSDDEVVGGAEGMAADMVALLDALEIERTAVAGWSMGGFVAQSLARREPGRVSALGLIATHTGGPDCVNGEPQVARELVDHSGTPREQASRLISLLFSPEVAPEFDQRFGEIVAAARAALPERVLFMQEETLGSWHGRPEPLPVLDPPVPTAIVHGGVDTVVPPGNAEVLARVHPGSTVEIRPACAHAVMAQEPEPVAEAILAATAG